MKNRYLLLSLLILLSLTGCKSEPVKNDDVNTENNTIEDDVYTENTDDENVEDQNKDETEKDNETIENTEEKDNTEDKHTDEVHDNESALSRNTEFLEEEDVAIAPQTKMTLINKIDEHSEIDEDFIHSILTVKYEGYTLDKEDSYRSNRILEIENEEKYTSEMIMDEYGMVINAWKDNGKIKAATWNKNGYNYRLLAEEGIDQEKLEKIYYFTE